MAAVSHENAVSASYLLKDKPERVSGSTAMAITKNGGTELDKR